YGHFSTYGDEFRLRLHPRRRFRISSPPVEILLRPDGRSAAFIAPSRTQHARYGHFSTHGDEFRLRLHPRRRFRISSPPVEILLRPVRRGAASPSATPPWRARSWQSSTYGDVLR